MSPRGVYPHKRRPKVVLPPRTQERLADDFWARVDRSGGPDACWPWMKALSRGGYGVFYVGDRKKRIASRAAWELTNGPIPEGLCVLHRCDNRPCCNPAHLWLGTVADNQWDASAKGRLHHFNPHKGEQHPLARLTWEKVRHIRANRGAVPAAELARLYGVTAHAIRQVARHKTWRE